MGKITIIGLGPGDVGSLTLQAVESISNGDRVFLRTKEHPTVSFFESRDISFKSYDYVYEQENSLDEVYKIITKDLLESATKYGKINYCVPGNPILGEKTVSELMDFRNKGEIELEIVPGMSFIESVIISLNRDPMTGFKIVDGLEFNEVDLDINSDVVIAHIYNKELAAEAKLKISELYGDEYKIFIIKSAGIKSQEKIVEIPVHEMDKFDWIDHLTSIFIPKKGENHKKLFDMNNLITIMEKLRSEKGCKWDIKQTHQSLREYLIEEAYEVVDAIDNEDVDLLCEELGDLLLQVVFHSQIAKEEGYFSIWDVLSGICSKLIYRHPHVFGEIEAKNDKEATDSWNNMKDKEKKISNHTERLKKVTKGLPSLLRSYKIQEKAADVGFDWKDISGAMLKVEEELLEVKEVYEGVDKSKIEEELGDLLFAVVNVCRFAHVNPETALNMTISKFVERFEYIERQSQILGKNLDDMPLEEMDKLWQNAKLHK